MSSKRPNWHQNPPNNKVPRIRSFPSDQKVPRITENPESTDRQTLAWKINILDYEGEWGWFKISADVFKNLVITRMREFEGMKWIDLGRQGSHPIPIKNLTKNAQKRLEEIRQIDVDSLFSLHLRGKERMWGIREGRIFKILWWDPDHTVCPSYKKHT